MNYIKQINAFYDQIELNPLTASATLLWHTLMHINNKARWVERFTVSVSVLRLKSGLTESSFKRARQELQDKGYIKYEPRPGNQAALYQIISQIYTGNYESESDAAEIRNNTLSVLRELRLEVDQADTITTNKAMHHSTGQIPNGSTVDVLNGIMAATTDRIMDVSVSDRTDGNAGALIKQKEMKNEKNTKQNNNNDDDCPAVVFFRENFNGISTYVTSEIKKWVAKLGEPLVLDAMKRTLELNKDNWAYVHGILQAWVQNGIRSVDEAILGDMEHKEKQKNRKFYGGSQVREEIVPDWFRDMKRKQKLESMKKGYELKLGEDW